MRKAHGFPHGTFVVDGRCSARVRLYGCLALLDIHMSTAVTVALGMSPIWVATALCWTAVYSAGLRRPEILLAAAAVTSWTLGSTYYVGLQSASGRAPFPTVADVGSALF